MSVTGYFLEFNFYAIALHWHYFIWEDDYTIPTKLALLVTSKFHNQYYDLQKASCSLLYTYFTTIF